ncbi:MAG: hypothetical protein SX243_12955 [Acidobacteriota bacterium]|nr:hypothetical protein [Acidobacteriota bacterium]
MHMANDSFRHAFGDLLRLLGLGLVALLAWAGTLLLAVRFLPDWEARGQFGDLFGSVNALFSGMALAGVVYSLYLQRKEIQLLREDLVHASEGQKQTLLLSREQSRHQKASAQLASINALFSYHQQQLAQARLDQDTVLIRASKAELAALQRHLETFLPNEQPKGSVA